MTIYTAPIPIVVMIICILVKKIPVVGGNVYRSLLCGGLVALLIGGIFNPIEWFRVWLDGINRLSWVMTLSIFGTYYAETQITLGSMDTVLTATRAAFGKTPKGLMFSIIITLGIAGSLLGDAVAVSTVLGVLIIKPLNDMGLKPEEISGTIVLGALLGSVCPPISSAVNTSSALLQVNLDDVMNMSYRTVPLIILLSAFYAAFRFIKIKELPPELIPEKKLGQILKEGFVSLIPMLVLLTIVILRSGPWKIDVITMIYGGWISFISDVYLIRGLGNAIMLAVVTCNVLCFISPKVRKRGVVDILKVGTKKVLPVSGGQLCAAFMLGSFFASGLINTISAFAQTLNEHALKLGGSGALMMMGMLTGSQQTAQNTILSFLGPAWVSTGVDPVAAAAAGAQIATAGQAMPPVDLLTFMVCGLVGGVLGVKVDTVKSMINSAPGFIMLALGGLLFLYL